MNKKEIETEISEFTLNIAKNPEKIEYYYYRAILYNKLGYWNSSIKDYSSMIELASNTSIPEKSISLYYANRAEAYANMGHFENAIKDYSTAIQKDNTNPWHYYYRGLAYSFTANWNLAIQDYSILIQIYLKGFSLKSDYIGICYANRGQAYKHTDQFSKALEDYQNALKEYSSAIESESENMGHYFNRAMIYLHLENWDLAIYDFNLLITIASQGFGVVAEYLGIAYFYRAFCYENLTHWQLAIDDYTNILNNQKKSINIAPHYEEFSFIKRSYSFIKLYEANYITPSQDPTQHKLNLYKLIEPHFNDHSSRPKDFLNTEYEYFITLYEIKQNAQENFFLPFVPLLQTLYIQVSTVKEKKRFRKGGSIFRYQPIYTLENLFSENSSFSLPLFNTIHLKELMEGYTFYKVLSQNNQPLQTFLNELYHPTSYFNNTYILNFYADKKDHLPFWIQYGNEADGFSLELPSNLFHKKTYALLFSNMHETIVLKDLNNDSILKSDLNLQMNFQGFKSTLHGKNPFPPRQSSMDFENNDCLYQVEYLLESDSAPAELTPIISTLQQIFSQLPTSQPASYQPFVMQWIADTLDQLRFLYKNKHFAHEQEVRIIRQEKNEQFIQILEEHSLLYTQLNQTISLDQIKITLGKNVAYQDQATTYLQYKKIEQINTSIL